VSAQAAAAYTKENAVRAAMGVPCATMVTTLNTASQKHCDYYSNNTGDCVADPHTEVNGCNLYVAANFWQRDTLAGYGGGGVFEVMHFVGNGTTAVQGWIDSVWHRTPVLSPWVRDFGYGNTTNCDTMDFGTGASTPATTIAYYPYANQTGLPTSFDGRYEGPTPPAPPGGWPSGYPITLYLRNATITSHTLTVDGNNTPIAHQWLDPASQQLLTNEYVMYANSPLTKQTTYRVTVEATRSGSPLQITWTFTTGG